MASIIRIKRSSTSGNPSTLGAGELAYSALTDNGSNGGDRLYIGMGTETAGNAVNHVVIGGKFFTDMLDHNKGTLTASSAIITDADSKIDNLLVDNLQLNGSTLSTTNTNGDLNITPNGTGKLVLTNTYIGDTSTSLAEYIQDVSGGAITDSDELDATYDDNAGTTSLALKTTGVTAGSYGSSTSIPTFTVDSKGRLTAAGTAALATTLNITGDSGSDGIALLSETLGFVGGTGITSTVTANTVTFDIDSTVATLTGTQTLTNKTLTSPVMTTPTLGVASATTINKVAITAPATGSTLTIADGKTLTASNTLTLTGNDAASVNFAAGGTVAYTGASLAQFASTTSAELKQLITDETGTGSLVFADSPTLVTPVLGAATATSVTATSGNLTLSAAAGNNNVNLLPTGTGIVDVGGKRVGNAADPQQAQDLVTKAYVDAMSNGLDVKASVRAATTGPLTATYTAGSGGGGSGSTNYNNTSTTFLGKGDAPPWIITSLFNGGTQFKLATGSAPSSEFIAAINALTTGSEITIIGDEGTITLTFTSGFDGTFTTAGSETYTASCTSTGTSSSITSISIPSAGGASGGGEGATLTNAGTQAALTLDSIAVAEGDRVLIKNQTDAMENGVYVVTTVGSASVNWVLTRASDFDNSPTTEVSPGTFFFVEEGTTQADNGYVISNDSAISIGSSDIIFSQFSGAGQITAGAGLTKSGNTLNVVGTADRITVNTDNVDIAATYVGQATITTLGTISTGTWQGTVIAGAYGGTGVDNSGKTITLGGNLTTAGAYNTTLTATANTSITLPTTGTLATLAGTESLSNKTITSSSFSGTTIAGSGLISFTNTTDAGPLGTAAVVMSGGLSVAKKVYVGTDIIGSGAGDSNIDGFNIDGGTY